MQLYRNRTNQDKGRNTVRKIGGGVLRPENISKRSDDEIQIRLPSEITPHLSNKYWVNLTRQEVALLIAALENTLTPIAAGVVCKCGIGGFCPMHGKKI